MLVTILAGSSLALAESIEKVYGNVHYTADVDDFTDEYSEIIAVMEDSEFMPKLFGFRCNKKTFNVVYKHQSLVFGDRGKLIYRVNDHEPVEVSVFLSDGYALMYGEDADSLLLEIVEADRVAGEVTVVLMIKGESRTKFKFSMTGIAKAVDNSKLTKQTLERKLSEG
jgi:hypothetical protein